MVIASPAEARFGSGHSSSRWIYATSLIRLRLPVGKRLPTPCTSRMSFWSGTDCLGRRNLLRERTCFDVVDHREAIRTPVDDTAIWNPLTREVFDMRSTVRAAVPAASAMYDLADLGYRFAIGPEKCAVSESKSFFPHWESSLTIRADVDASVRLVEHTLDDPSRYRALRAPRREEDTGVAARCVIPARAKNKRSEGHQTDDGVAHAAVHTTPHPTSCPSVSGVTAERCRPVPGSFDSASP